MNTKYPDSIEHLPTETLTPYARNARTHSPEQIEQIAASIREFGFTNPILIDAKNEIIAGHGRVMAAQQLGIKTLPCIRLEHLTENQKRAYVIADNQIALNSGWDIKLLESELDAIKQIGYEIDILGFDEKELNEILFETKQEQEKKRHKIHRTKT